MSHTLKDTNDLAIKTAILRSHPVGSIYWSFQKTDPASLFGGTWERVKDTFILAAGDTYQAGATGGQADVTLVADQIPSHTHPATSNSAGEHAHTATTSWDGNHTHGFDRWLAMDYGVSAEYHWNCAGSNASNVHTDAVSTQSAGGHNHSLTTTSNGAHSHTISVGATGWGKSHTNMPPYLVAYCWKRTA